jgi:hypothetical protein
VDVDLGREVRVHADPEKLAHRKLVHGANREQPAVINAADVRDTLIGCVVEFFYY